MLSNGLHAAQTWLDGALHRDNNATGTTASPYLAAEELSLMQRWWQAANYLTVGQIYLQDNALLTRPLEFDEIKPRLLGHWGTSPGLSMLYVHTNRVIKAHCLNVIFLVGPGHGGPAIVAAAYLEGTYTEVYSGITSDAAGIRKLFRQFSTPGGIPSHVSPPTPGSIHEGGELGYVLMHAFGAVMDNPDLLAVAVVGDGESETGPLEGSWKGISYLSPVHDGACCPSCTSTATGSVARPSSVVSVTPTSLPCSLATATQCTGWKGTTPLSCITCWHVPWTWW